MEILFQLVLSHFQFMRELLNLTDERDGENESPAKASSNVKRKPKVRKEE